LGPNASSAWWARQAWQWVRAHPGHTAALVLRRLTMMWNRREYPQIENAEVYEHVAGPLGVPLVGSFALLGALALAGIPFAWRRGPAGRFVAGDAIVPTPATLPFFVTDRFRSHLVPAAALLAAISLDRARRALAAGGHAWRTPALAIVVGLAIVNLPAPSLSGGKQAWGA